MTLGPGRDNDATAPPAGASGPMRARPGAIAAAFLLGALFLAVFLSRFTPAAVALGRAAEPAAAAVVVLLAGYAMGALALWLARSVFQRAAKLPPGEDRLESSAVLLVGLPVFGTVVAALAWTGFAIQLQISLLSIGLAVVGATRLARRRPLLGVVTVWDVALLGPPVVIALLGALSPVSSPDELVYKLAVPKAYLLFGGMLELPLNSYSYASTALSHVSLAALALSGGVAAKLVHAALFVAALATVRRLGEELEPGAGPWVAAVVAWTPALMLIAGWAWTEWAVLALLLLSYLGWLAYQRRPEAGAAALLVASLAGAAAIKYTALPWIVVFAVLAAIRLARRGRTSAAGPLQPVSAGPPTDGEGPRGAAPPPRQTTDLRPDPGLVRLLGAAALVLVALGGFFYLRNWIWSGSPVAPFLLDGAPTIEHYRSQGTLSGWQELLLGYDIVHRGIVDDALGILLPLCALMAPLAWLANRAARDLFWIGLVPLPFLVATAPTSRLILTSVVPLAVMGAAQLARSFRALEGGLVRGAVAAVAGVALAAQLFLVLWVIVTSHDPLRVVLGDETEGAYLGRMRPYTAVYRWIEEKTPPTSRVLLIGENRSYGLERPTFSAGNFDGDRMARFLGGHSDAPALARDLRHLGVTHVVVHWPWLRVEGRANAEIGMLEREYLQPLSQPTALVLQDLVDRIAARRYQDQAYSVYELPPLEAADGESTR